MGKQLDLFLDAGPTGEQLRDAGMAQAIDHADAVTPGWSMIAFDFLQSYMKEHDEFMAEDVRVASEGVVPKPPVNCAWGGVFARASKAGLITHLRFQNVKNPKAHATPRSVWSVVKKTDHV